MLVLTRRPGEWVSIGDSVTVKVLSVRGDQVQLGIDAPRTLRVDRGEIRARILAEMEAAQQSASDAAAWDRWVRRRGGS